MTRLRDHMIYRVCVSIGVKQRDQEMAETFLVAINCWDFLHSNVTYGGGKEYGVWLTN